LHGKGVGRAPDAERFASRFDVGNFFDRRPHHKGELLVLAWQNDDRRLRVLVTFANDADDVRIGRNAEYRDMAAGIGGCGIATRWRDRDNRRTGQWPAGRRSYRSDKCAGRQFGADGHLRRRSRDHDKKSKSKQSHAFRSSSEDRAAVSRFTLLKS
jgi:hypothetical protein